MVPSSAAMDAPAKPVSTIAAIRGPSSRNTQELNSRTSASESLRPGISKVVISTHTFDSCTNHTKVSSTSFSPAGLLKQTSL